MKKTVFVFPGQGSQYVGMGKRLWEKSETVKRVFKTADEVLGFPLTKLCFEGTDEELKKTENAQPALLTVGVAMYQYCMEQYEAAPVYLAGHSLGEYTALVCSQAISFADALKLVRKRGQYMQEAVPDNQGGMAAVIGLDREVIKKVCKEHSKGEQCVVLANDNSKFQKVISGNKELVEVVGKQLETLGATVKSLNVSGPFHSPLMNLAKDKLYQDLMKCKYQPMQIPVISNVTAMSYKEQTAIIDGLAKQIVSPVQWNDTMKFFEHQGVELLVELGPKKVLKNLVKSNQMQIKAYSFDEEQDEKSLASEHFTKKISLKELDPEMTVITRCMAMAVATKNNNFVEEEYVRGVVQPYQKLKQMQEEIEEKQAEPTKQQMLEALNLLKMVFETKKVPKEEQIQRYHRVLEETKQQELEKEFKIPV